MLSKQLKTISRELAVYLTNNRVISAREVEGLSKDDIENLCRVVFDSMEEANAIFIDEGTFNDFKKALNFDYSCYKSVSRNSH